MFVTQSLAALVLFASPPESEAQPSDQAAVEAAPDEGEDAAVVDAGALAAELAAMPGWGDLSPQVQDRLQNMDDGTMEDLTRRMDAGEPLSPEDQAVADGIIHLAQAEFESQLSYQTGDIPLGDGLATLHLGEDFRYLGPTDADKIIVDAWGNPPGQETLGMIFPVDVSPLDEKRGWGVIISYVEEGHVDDDDAEDIDYDELLTEMKKATAEENEVRKQQGYPALELVGWAEAPHYDEERHSLYWAKELAGEGAPEHSLNYAIRVLGRKGVLELNAVAGMSQLASIRPAMETVYSRVEFAEGQRYIDFDPDIDQVAAYGLGGLIAGKMAMKAGLFAGLLKILVAGKKFLFLFVIGAVAGVKAFFGRGKSGEVAEPQTPPEPTIEPPAEPRDDPPADPPNQA